jgi:hypothetical protein
MRPRARRPSKRAHGARRGVWRAGPCEAGKTQCTWGRCSWEAGAEPLEPASPRAWAGMCCSGGVVAISGRACSAPPESPWAVWSFPFRTCKGAVTAGPGPDGDTKRKGPRWRKLGGFTMDDRYSGGWDRWGGLATAMTVARPRARWRDLCPAGCMQWLGAEGAAERWRPVQKQRAGLFPPRPVAGARAAPGPWIGAWCHELLASDPWGPHRRGRGAQMAPRAPTLPSPSAAAPAARPRAGVGSVL